MNPRVHSSSAGELSELIEQVDERLRAGRNIRIQLPDGGRLHIDRPLPFLCLYRMARREEWSGMERVAESQAAYLVSTDKHIEALRDLIAAIAKPMRERYGAFLVLELWEIPEAESGEILETRMLSPAFILAGHGEDMRLTPALDALEMSLSKLRIHATPSKVDRLGPDEEPNPGKPPMIGGPIEWDWLGLGIRPIYRSLHQGEYYPHVLVELAARLCPVIQRGLFGYVKKATAGPRPPSYLALGRKALVRAARQVDRRLDEVSRSFDFLLLCTPVNVESAWARFEDDGCEKPPHLLYRPLPFDPELTKRELHNLPIERVEDPVLSALFREKQKELDRQITMLIERGTYGFLLGSRQLFGEIPVETSHLAREILEKVQPECAREGETVDAKILAQEARREFAGYNPRWFKAGLALREDIASGLMTSQEQLLIAPSVRIPRRRVDALMQHEIGTHLVTFFNGRSQGLHLLCCGLPGYETLQEGLAVIAEYLVNGLTARRLRMLAARVLAVEALAADADFIEIFQMLHREHGFSEHGAYRITARVWRSGGFTKDMIYLDGLRRLLAYMSRKGNWDPLLCGRIGFRHIAMIEGLRQRGVLRRPPLLPRYLQREDCLPRLKRLSHGLSVFDLTQEG